MDSLNNRPPPPVILLVYANDLIDRDRHLRYLKQEVDGIANALREAKQEKLCEVVVKPDASTDEVISVFQDREYRNRVALFHYAGHADSDLLQLESAAGGHGAAHAQGLAEFFGLQNSLQLVFLNGCETEGQVRSLLGAGCRAVITTHKKIDDEIAMTFAARFYAGLGGGDIGLEKAYNEAVAATKSKSRDGRPRSLYWGDLTPQEEAAIDRWPWELRTRAGDDSARGWKLREAANNHLFGLPKLPKLDPPESPFLGLHWFKREHAGVFFGRGAEIRALYEAVMDEGTAPIILFYGQSGVGKSSVLEAGLLPRLGKTHVLHYLRRDKDLGLLGTLLTAFGDTNMTTADAWHAVEDAVGKKPLLIILDQVEEVYTRPNDEHPDELSDFIIALSDIFGEPTGRPQGRLILGFRKEWEPEIVQRLKERGLRCNGIFIETIERPGIIEAITGPASTPQLRREYRLKIDEDLAGEIADDLLADRGSPVAPTLQILLTKLWDRVVEFEHHCFTRDLYLTLKKEGILLGDFLDQQLKELDKSKPDIVKNGLALDVLAYHTTPRGFAAQCTEEELTERYRNYRDLLPDFVSECKRRSLLADLPSPPDQLRRKGSRLAHDTLAPLVRERFEDSDRPGQRARRILENRAPGGKDRKTGLVLDDAGLATVEAGVDHMRAVDADTDKAADKADIYTGTPLDDTDLRTVERGLAGMRAPTDAEQRLLTTSRRIASIRKSIETHSDPLVAALVVEALDAFPTMGDRTRLARLAVDRPVPSALLRGHEGAITSTAFSPDGARLVTASADRTARIWSACGSGDPVVLRGHDAEVMSAAFSPDGTRVITAALDGTARVWWADGSGEPVVLRCHESWVGSADFSPDGTHVVTGSNNSTRSTSVSDSIVRIWAADGSGDPVVLPGHNMLDTTAAFSPDGTHVVTGSEDDYAARVWRADGSGDPVVLRGQGGVRSAAFSPDGSRVVTTSADGAARIWAADGSGDPIVLRGHNASLAGARFSPDGSRLVTTSAYGDFAGTAWVWAADGSGDPVVLGGHEAPVVSAAFSPNGALVITASVDRTARISAADGKGDPVVLRGHKTKVVNAVFSPDGRRVVTTSADGKVRVWSAGGSVDPVVLRGHEGPVYSAAFSLDGMRVVTASGDGTVRVWRADGSGALVMLVARVREVFSATFSPDGSRVVTASSDADNETVQVWRTDGSAEPVLLPAFVGEIFRPTFSPDGTRVVTALPDGTVRIWAADGSDDSVELHGHDGPVASAMFSPDGTRLVTASVDGTARVWAADGSADPIVLHGHDGGAISATFSPDGTRVITTSNAGTAQVQRADGSGAPVLLPAQVGAPFLSYPAFSPDGTRVVTALADGTARIWMADGSGEAVVLRGHSREVLGATFSPDGTRVVTASADRTARIWAADGSGDPIVLRGHDDFVTGARFSPDGSHVVTASGDGTARVWRADWNVLLTCLRNATTACLMPVQRRELLGESAEEAQARYEVCERKHGRTPLDTLDLREDLVVRRTDYIG